MVRKIQLNESEFKALIDNILNEAIGGLFEGHLAVVDNIDEIVNMVGEAWKSQDDVWWIKFDSRLKDFKNYNQRNPDKPDKWWTFRDKTDSTRRENHVGYVIVRGATREACQESIKNAVVHLNPWAAKQFGTNLVYSNGNADAIRTVCNAFFARAYITINSRSMTNTIQKARMDKNGGGYNPFKGREFHHRVGQPRTGIDGSGVNWSVLRPYGLVDCDVDNPQAQAELEQYFKDNGVDIKLKRQSHDGMHYIISTDQAKNLNFDFMDKYSTNNKRGDPQVLFKPDANIIVYSPVG